MSQQSNKKILQSKQKAEQLKKQGKFTEALQIYNLIYDQGKGQKASEVLRQKSSVHHILGQNKQAIRFLTESIQLEETADKYCTLADYNNQNQDHQQAIKNYSKALDIKQTSVQQETRDFLQNSVVIKQLPEIQNLINQNGKLQARIGQGPTNDVQDLMNKANKSITIILKYCYNKEQEAVKEEKITDLKNMINQMMNRITLLQQQNKKMKGQQHGFYKNHELLFIQSLENSTLSPENQQVLKTYFTTFCNQMELFFLTLKLLNKVPDAALTMQEIYTHTQGGQQALIQIENKLKKIVDNLEKFKSAFENIPYVSILFGIFKQFDIYFNKYVEKVHDTHKIGAITNTWMNSQVFNDFASDLASRTVHRMKLRIINHSEPSFKSYLKVLWSKLIKRYRYKTQAGKLKQLQKQQYNRNAYIAKLAERDAAIIFYSFEMHKLTRKGDMEQMTDDVLELISQFEGMKIDDQLFVKQKIEQKKGGYCLLF